MIRLVRPAEPDVLKQRGGRKAGVHKAAYTKDPTAYQTGRRSFTFASGIYGHETVRIALLGAQYGKCCYCEAMLGPTMSSGEVEHFRPKAAVRQDEKQALQKPGYYWLAYEWENLLISCRDCNVRHKRTYFPLAIPQRRAKSHHANIAAEEPLLINPYSDAPVDHIGFNSEFAFARNRNAEGEATIKFVGLNRMKLRESRLDRLNLARIVKRLSEFGPTEPMKADAARQLAKMRSAAAPFSQMLIENGV